MTEKIALLVCFLVDVIHGSRKGFKTWNCCLAHFLCFFLLFFLLERLWVFGIRVVLPQILGEPLSNDFALTCADQIIILVHIIELCSLDVTFFRGRAMYF